MKRVYVSSTLEDLRSERRIVLDVIKRLGGVAIGMEYYGADERRPLQKCVDDVKSCDIYVGIVGWRRGYCPPETPRASITEGEYLAAGEAGIPRLLYLKVEAPDRQGAVDADLAAIHAYRARIATEVSAFPFQSSVELTMSVGADLASRLVTGKSPRIGDQSLLPYLCDRAPQNYGIQDQLEVARDSVTPVCVVHGDHDQSLSRFVDCLRYRNLPEWLERVHHPVKEVRVDWFDDAPSDVPRRVRQALARALRLDVRSTTDEALHRQLAAYPGPVLVTLQLPTETWSEAHARRLEAFAAYFHGWPRSGSPKPDLVLIWAEYPRAKPGLLRVFALPSASERRRRAVIDAIQNLRSTPGLALLPVAKSVGRSDARDWARRDEVRLAAGDTDIDAEIDRLYFEREWIPMQELSLRLSELLK